MCGIRSPYGQRRPCWDERITERWNTPGRSIWNARQRAALFDLPRDEAALLRHYTLSDDAGTFGLMNIFARTLGGFFGDRMGIRFGLKGRVMFLGGVLLVEGLALILFSQMATLFLAVGAMIVFSLFVQMSEGATFSVVPFINRKALGSVAGIVGAGGNAGAVAFGFLFRAENLSYADALLIVGVVVIMASTLVLAVLFSPETEREERRALDLALAEGSGLAPSAAD